MISAQDAFSDVQTFSRERARPMAPEDRRDAILDAAIPLLKERGRDVSTRQIAEAAGVAEGTLFRAFGDKESIITAAIDRYFDPEPFRAQLREIDPDDPPADKVLRVFGLLRERFAGVVGFATALGLDHRSKPKPTAASEGEWTALLASVFRPGELACDSPTLGFYLRLVAFGTAIPPFYEVHPFDTDELVDLILHGVLATATERGN